MNRGPLDREVFVLPLDHCPPQKSNNGILKTNHGNFWISCVCCSSDISEMDLLMIDGMVDNMGVRELWDREGGNGQYPPPSLHVSCLPLNMSLEETLTFTVTEKIVKNEMCFDICRV